MATPDQQKHAGKTAPDLPLVTAKQASKQAVGPRSSSKPSEGQGPALNPLCPHLTPGSPQTHTQPRVPGDWTWLAAVPLLVQQTPTQLSVPWARNAVQGAPALPRGPRRKKGKVSEEEKEGH